MKFNVHLTFPFRNYIFYFNANFRLASCKIPDGWNKLCVLHFACKFDLRKEEAYFLRQMNLIWKEVWNRTKLIKPEASETIIDDDVFASQLF